MYRRYVKRLLDFVFAVAALPLWFIVLIIIAPIIYCEDRGSVFYNAPRLGLDGRVFTMFKFRTMKVNAPDIRNPDGSTFNAEDDPRLTKVGRFLRKISLDETPQILNVLKGDMSIIGPRPDLPEHRVLYVGEDLLKLEMRPGITGYSQAYYRNAIEWKDRIRNDVFYAKNVCLLMDFRIFLRTLVTVIRSENLYVVQRTNSSLNKPNK